ncbi:MAG: chromosomal replication initiator protein DnaA [Solobacterium sp.]|nr:chromosomal replication initiator protein DnaA [Solobacterium sp.]
MTTGKNEYLKKTWNDVLTYLRTGGNIDLELINSLYEPCSVYDFTDEKVILLAPNVISKQIMMSEADLIESAFIETQSLDHPITLEIYTQNELPKKSSVTSAPKYDINEFPSMPIQSDKTFDNFIVGDCNKESHAAALACSIKPGKFFNPLFIYGNSGLGKTHLLMAIANNVRRTDPTKKIYYTESLKFVETVVKAIYDGKIEAFKQFMYSLDLFLVDDIQFLAGKEKSHEVFFTIYNELVNNRKQICIACDRQPKEISGLEDRLISRFSSGLSVGIDSPEFETSLAILQLKIRSSSYDFGEIEEEGLNYIASNFSGNVRDLEGALNRVLFYAIQFQPDGDTIRFETVMNALKSQAVVSTSTGLSPRKIINSVADYYGLTKQQITSKTRTKNVANARHIAIYFCRKLLDLSYSKIGDEFGGLDHSTVISACTKVENNIKSSDSYRTAIDEIRRQLA